MTQKNKTILCFIGPSGSGKTTISRSLQLKHSYPEFISHTTRPIRKGEKNGKDYYFVSEEKFQELCLLESEIYSGNFYGLSLQEVQRVMSQADIAYCVITYKGYMALKKQIKDARVISVFIHTDAKACIQRMKQRGDNESSIQSRISNYDLKTPQDDLPYDFIIDNSGTIEESITQLENILHYTLGHPFCL